MVRREGSEVGSPAVQAPGGGRQPPASSTICQAHGRHGSGAWGQSWHAACPRGGVTCAAAGLAGGGFGGAVCLLSLHAAADVWAALFSLAAPRGKRGWKPFHAILKGMILYLQKVGSSRAAHMHTRERDHP